MSGTVIETNEDHGMCERKATARVTEQSDGAIAFGSILQGGQETFGAAFRVTEEMVTAEVMRLLGQDAPKSPQSLAPGCTSATTDDLLGTWRIGIPLIWANGDPVRSSESDGQAVFWPTKEPETNAPDPVEEYLAAYRRIIGAFREAERLWNELPQEHRIGLSLPEQALAR